MRKKIVGLLMVMLLFLSSAICFADRATADAQKTSADFSDLKDLDAATKAKFDALISAGIFDGVAEGKFGLQDEMNRAQFAKVAALIFGLEVDTNAKTSSFKDVQADDPANGYAMPYIEAVKAAGITDGYGEGTYNPAGEVTKEQLATFLIRGLGMKDDAMAMAMAKPSTSDASVSDWAKGYVALALEKKLLTNGEDGTFGGKSNATRDQLVLSSYQTAVTAYDIREQSAPEDQVEDGSLSAHELFLKKIKETDQILQESQETKEEKVGNDPIIPYIPYNPPVTRLTLDAPTALPASGVVASGTLVTLKGMPADAAVYYTTDLSDPTTSSTLYTEPVTITSSTTIKAIAVHPEANTSSIARFDYTVTMPIVMPDTISPMTEGQPFSGSAAKLSGGTGDVTYAVTDGALPAGLTLDPSTGAITGTPSVSGAYSFTITATDSATPPAVATQQYAGTITPAITKTPLDLINEALETGEWDAIDETTFADAGVTDVTISNVSAVIDALGSNGTSPLTVIDIQAAVNSVNADITKQAALDLINAEAASGQWDSVTETTFAAAGITGITAENLSGIQGMLQDYDYPSAALPKTSADIQAIVDEMIHVAVIFAYLDANGGGSSPTVEIFARAGITGVNDSNLDAILYELNLAYQESRSNPFATPLSSKQQIQDLIDLYFPVID
jgi:hypothetical protein